MEDTATAEIARSQVWQWVHSPKGSLSDGRELTLDLVRTWMTEEMDKIEEAVGAEAFRAGRFEQAASLFEKLVSEEAFVDFLTWIAYDHLD
jgi:malate synthase